MRRPDVRSEALAVCWTLHDRCDADHRVAVLVYTDPERLKGDAESEPNGGAE